MGYGKVNMNALKKRKKEIAARAGRGFFTAAQGENVLRILPPWEGSDTPFKEVEQHFITVRGKTEAFTCPLSVGEDHCYVCDVVIPRLNEEAQEEDGEESQEILEKISPQLRIFCNILDLTDSKTEKQGIQQWAFSQTRYNEILGFFNDPDYGDITDPKHGTNLVLNRRGEKLNTKYNLFPKRKSTAIDTSLLKELPNLDDLLAPLSEEEIQKLMLKAYGIDYADTENISKVKRHADDDEDESPKKPKKSSKHSKRDLEADDVDDDEDDDAIVDDDDADDDEEESTKRNSRRKSRDDDDDDDDDDSDDSDDSDDDDSDDNDDDEDDSDDDEDDSDDDEDEEDVKSDGKRTAIVLPKGLKHKARKDAVAKAAKKSKCFGKLFKEDNQVCENCGALVECAVQVSQDEDSTSKKSKKSDSKTTSVKRKGALNKLRNRR